MDDLQRMELRGGFGKASDTPLFDVIGKLRRNKPGPKKKNSPRSEKESCRLTKEEADQFRKSCKARRVRPADYIRECCLAASYTPATVEKTKMVADVFMRLEEMQGITGQMRKQSIVGKTDSTKSASEIGELNNRITAVQKTLRAVLYAGILVLAASAAHVEAERGDIMDMMMRLKNDISMTLGCALIFGFCVGIVAEKLSDRGHLSLASARNWVKHLRGNH